MVQFLSIIFFLGFLQFLLGFSKFPVFLCHPVLLGNFWQWHSWASTSRRWLKTVVASLLYDIVFFSSLICTTWYCHLQPHFIPFNVRDCGWSASQQCPSFRTPLGLMIICRLLYWILRCLGHEAFSLKTSASHLACYVCQTAAQKKNEILMISWSVWVAMNMHRTHVSSLYSVNSFVNIQKSSVTASFTRIMSLFTVPELQLVS